MTTIMIDFAELLYTGNTTMISGNMTDPTGMIRYVGTLAAQNIL